MSSSRSDLTSEMKRLFMVTQPWSDSKKKLKSGYRWNSNLEHYKTEFFQGHSFPRKLPWRFCQGLPPGILQSKAHN